MSSSVCSVAKVAPVKSLFYQEIEAPGASRPDELWADGATMPAAPPAMAESYSQEDLRQRVERVRAETTLEVKDRLAQQHAASLADERLAVVKAVADFRQQREEYFAHVESELVQLALAIAAKILHREVQIDRMLLAALARVAVENLQHRSNVTIRVRPEECERWRDYFQMHLRGSKVEILEDSQLKDRDCVLETELGTADVSIDAQLKEIERGFFDLLAQRPGEQ